MPRQAIRLHTHFNIRSYLLQSIFRHSMNLSCFKKIITNTFDLYTCIFVCFSSIDINRLNVIMKTLSYYHQRLIFGLIVSSNVLNYVFLLGFSVFIFKNHWDTIWNYFNTNTSPKNQTIFYIWRIPKTKLSKNNNELSICAV